MANQEQLHNILPSELIILGADEIPQIEDEITTLENFLQKAPDTPLRDIAYTTGTLAKDSLVRAAIVASNTTELQSRLKLLRSRIQSGITRAFYTSGVFIGTGQCPVQGRTVFLFPGEGSQYQGMLRTLALNSPICRKAFDDADTASASAGFKTPPSRWVYPPIDKPQHSQIATLGIPAAVQTVIAADTALLHILTKLKIFPDAVAGVGIGELVALEAAGVIKYQNHQERLQALIRGNKLISSLCSQKMPKCLCFSVSSISKQTIENAITQFPDQAIITRDQASELYSVCAKEETFPALKTQLEKLGAVIRLLPISLPFHTPWISSLLNDLQQYYTSLITQEPEVPVYSFKTGAQYEGKSNIWPSEVASQWSNPTQINKTINKLYDDGFRVFVEVGARGILSNCVTGVLRQSNTPKPHLALALNRGHRPDINQLNTTLATLVSHGADINIEPLHKLRGSQLLDLQKSQQIKPKPQTILQTTIPTFTKIKVPNAFTALPPNLTPITENIPTQSQPQTTNSNYPIIQNAKTIDYKANTWLDIILPLSTINIPALISRAIAPNGISETSKNLYGLQFIPLEILLEAMAEAAQKLAPTKNLIRIKDLHGNYELRINKEKLNVRIIVHHKLTTEESSTYTAKVLACEANDSEAKVLAQAELTFSSTYPDIPIVSLEPLLSPQKVELQGQEIYKTLPIGQHFQALQNITEIGENGLRGEITVEPHTNAIANTTTPNFTIDPILISAIGASLALCSEKNTIHLPTSCDLIEIHAPAFHECNNFKLSLTKLQTHPNSAKANCDIYDISFRSVIHISGWTNHVLHISENFKHYILSPKDSFFTSELERPLIPNLSTDITCSIAPIDKFTIDDFDLKMDILASISLSQSELEKWNELTASQTRRTEWLYGRIAAKDAVRRCLLSRYGRKLSCTDIKIVTDDAGKPSPSGEWRKFCGAQMDISITHSASAIIAAAAPNSSIGIDIESIHRPLSDEFISAAFSTTEQEIAAESGNGEITLLRFWCAKEAMSKALGTGLRYGASDLCARTFDKSTGRIELEATHLWLSPFPHLHSKHISIETCIINDLILAICTLRLPTPEE